jgi:Domain of unknown function (DUF4328)
VNNSIERPKSSAFGRVLIRLLRLNLGLSALSLFLTLIQAALPSVYAALKGLDGLQAVLGLGVVLIAIVVFGVWIYRLHVDLANRFQGYPISPRRALAQCFIPIYYIWGLPQTFRVLARRLKSEDGQSAADGKALEKWTQWLAAAIGANALLFTAGRQLPANQDVLNGALYDLFSTAIGLLQAVVWLRIAELVSKIVDVKAPMQKPEKQATTVPRTYLAIFGGLGACSCSCLLGMLATCMDIPSPCMPPGTETVAFWLAVLGSPLLVGGLVGALLSQHAAEQRKN